LDRVFSARFFVYAIELGIWSLLETRAGDVCCGREGIKGKSGTVIDVVVVKVLDLNMENAAAIG
jgi:hypothetical protein